MKKKYCQETKITNKLYIVVEGGVVQSVYHNVENLDINIIDWDNAECDEKIENENDLLLDQAEAMPYQW